MNSMLEVFLSEARELLEDVSTKLMQMEQAPDDANLMNGLFRAVHTIKGGSGMVELPEMTRVLHAGEDLMDAVRKGRLGYSRDLADQLLEAMDFVGALCDEVESTGRIDAARAADSARLAELLRALIPAPPAMADEASAMTTSAPPPSPPQLPIQAPSQFAGMPEPFRQETFRRILAGETMHWLVYTPVEECFYQGADPFFQARQTPDLLWGEICARKPWPKLAELDAYRCVLDFRLVTAAAREVLDEYYRSVPDQVEISVVDPWLLVIPQGDPNGGPVYDDFVDEALRHLEAGNLASLKQGAQSLQRLSNPALWFSSVLRWLILFVEIMPDNHAAHRILIESLRTVTPPDWTTLPPMPLGATTAVEKDAPASGDFSGKPPAALPQEDVAVRETILTDQRRILLLDDHPAWLTGRLKAVATVLTNCWMALGDATAATAIDAALAQSVSAGNGAPLLAWLDAKHGRMPGDVAAATAIPQEPPPAAPLAPADSPAPCGPEGGTATTAAEEVAKFTRRAEDQHAITSLKVDQSKIDRLMNLIGEMVVSKNALPYLAQRAECQYGVRELSREIKNQYAVINRIAEEMQDAIMQVRMMPVSFVFQRFQRLVRDLSRKLGKDVNLVIEGEDTEADKNIIESLADPLIHIIRNSLDHGLETPEVRRAAGKSPTSTLTIRAAQEADRVVIEIIDDGTGIDPGVIKRKAYEKGLISEAALERISDQEAINLIFAAGLSTATVVSDLSGRGVGMDVVRTAVEKVNGDLLLESELGKGTRLRISLPLSMAVTKVMLVESDRQLFGVPMDHVLETVRVARGDIHAIKQSRSTVLRGRIVPIKTLNALLGLSSEPKANADDELALLVVRVGGEAVGLVVDNFRETVDIIQKPLSGVLAGLAAYSGSALMGDGSVLMVLNIKEIV